MERQIPSQRIQRGGINFRSKTEVRWARFFEDFSSPFEYEQHYYELEDGSRYLPDFYLPIANLWVEVKGQPPTLREEYKATQLSLITRKPVLIVCNSPRVVGASTGLCYIESFADFGAWLCVAGKLRRIRSAEAVALMIPPDERECELSADMYCHRLIARLRHNGFSAQYWRA